MEKQERLFQFRQMHLRKTQLQTGKEAVADKLTGTIVKEIYVPKKIINIVQK